MKEIILVVALVFWMLGAMAETQAYGGRAVTQQTLIERSDADYWSSPDEIQYENGGESTEYVHGSHCMDSRVF